MELRILKDGTVVLVAPDSALLEIAEKTLTENDSRKETAQNGAAEDENTRQRK